MEARFSPREKGMQMKLMYPKILSWLAKQAGIPRDTAEALWIESLRDATEECSVVESPEYWKSATDHLLQRVTNESQARRAAPFGWGSLTRLPATQWLHGLITVEAMLFIALRTTRDYQNRPSLQVRCSRLFEVQ